MLRTSFVAKLMGISPQTVINWLENGKLPFQRVERGPRLIEPAELLKFLEAMEIPSNSLDQDLFNKLCELGKRAQTSLPSLPALVMVNREGIVVSWNEGAYQMFGIHPSQVIQRPLSVVPGKVETTGKSLEHCVLTSWHAPFAEVQVSHVLSKSKTIRTHLVISRFYGKTTSAGGFVLSFSML